MTRNTAGAVGVGLGGKTVQRNGSAAASIRPAFNSHGGHSRFRTLLNHVPEPKCKQPVRAWIWMQIIGDRTCSIPKSKDVNSSVFRVAMASPEILYHRAVSRVECGEGFA
jgi:hypothetical protein